MNGSGDHRGAVPIVRSVEEAHEAWSRCEEEGRPFMVVTEDGEEYHVLYDMGPAAYRLRDGCVDQIEDTFSRCPELYHDGVGDPPEFQDLAWRAGPEQGSIGPLDGYTALSVASDTAEVVHDEANWVASAAESSNSRATTS